MKVTPAQALKLLSEKNSEFETVFKHGTLEVEIYRPDRIDKQQPHQRDEVYIVISGEGEFVRAGERTRFHPGDFLFVPAFMEHRFENFSDDFATWVLFYGPEGGESN